MVTIPMQASADSARSLGDLLRLWRQRRRRSQLDLALDAEISQRHLSFVESGRAAPSREMVLRLAEQLEVPLRARNALLLAAGYAPIYQERALDDPAMSPARRAVDTILHAHGAYPALAVDRHWHLIAANAAVGALLAGVVDPALLVPPVNVLRLSLHPLGLGPHIANLPEWRAHVLDRLRRQVEASADPVLTGLLNELVALKIPHDQNTETPLSHYPLGHYPLGGIAVPLELDTAEGQLSLISTTTVFGTPVEVTLSEMAIEAFYPANDITAERLHRLQGLASARPGV